MSFLNSLFSRTKEILNKGKDVVLDQLSSEMTVTPQDGIVSSTGNKPKAVRTAKEFLTPGRGYTDQQINNAKLNPKDSSIGLLKAGGEIAKGGVDIVSAVGRTIAKNTLPGYRAYSDSEASVAYREKIDTAIEDKLKPANPSQAKAMRLTDFAGLAPVGSIKNVSKISKFDDGQRVARSAELENIISKREGSAVIDTRKSYENRRVYEVTADDLLGESIDGKNGIDPKRVEFYKEKIQKGEELEPLKIAVKDGDVFVQDGRNRLAAMRELGVDFVPVVDVSRPLGRAVAGSTPETAKATRRTGANFDINKKDTTVLERTFGRRAADMFPETDKIGGTYSRRSTTLLAQKAQNLITDNPALAEKVALTDRSEVGVAVASEYLNKLARDADAVTDAATKNALYDKAAEIANEVATRLTEAGQTVQAATILGRMTPEGQIRFAAKTIQKYNRENPTRRIPELTGEQAKFIGEEMQAIRRMPDGEARAMRLNELQNFVNELVPTPLWKKIANTWKAGLLTGLKTTGLNIASNIGNLSLETLKDVPAVIVDKAASLFTGSRTKTLTMRNAFEGMKDGVYKGNRYFWTGFDERNIGAKLDYTRVNYGKGKVAKAFQAYTDTVFRFIGAQDQPIYYSVLSRSMMDQALAAGKNQGLRGKELVNYAYKVVEDPTEEMIRYATLDATTAVFQNKTALGEVAKKFQQIPYIGQFVVPFAQTPSAVAMQILNYSPVGIVKTLIENIGKGKFDQRLFSQGIGRGIVGTAPLVIGAALYENGMVSLDYPAGDERQIELDKAQGKSYNSIRMGDSWRNANVLGPAGNLILMGAYFQKAIQEVGSPAQAMLTAGMGALNSFTEQTFLTGVQNFVDAVSDPERYAKNYLPNLAASFIPTIVSDTARTADGMERNSNASSFAESFVTKAQARTPFARSALPPQVSALGEEIPLGGNALETMLDPTRPSADRSTFVTAELDRLMSEGIRVAPTKLGDKNGYDSLNIDQNTELWKLVGTLVNEKLNIMFTKKAYQEMPDDEKEGKINAIVDKAKDVGRAQFILLQTEGLTRDQERELLAKHKESGLLSKNVFAEYKKLRNGNTQIAADNQE